MRNNTIDIAKGFLIICVILGHLLLDTLNENVVRYVIYSFHMPLFMFLSGYLINISKMSSLSTKDIVSKYWDRMLKMWLLAYIVFSAYQVLRSPSIHQICTLIYSPWYHLWYIPTLFCYIVLVKIIFGRLNKVTAYSILLVLFIIWTIIKTKIAPMSMPRWCDFTNMPYFALGLFLKNHFDSQRFQKSYWIVPILFIPATIMTKFVHIQTYGLLSMALLGVVIMFFLYPSIKKDLLPQSKTLSYIGQNSLNIYLWHMAIFEPLKNFISDTTIYYCVSFSILFAFLAIVKFKLCK